MQLARIGMSDSDAMARGNEFAEDRLLVGPLMNIFGFDETNVAAGPADRLRVIHQNLHEEVALILRQFDAEPGIVRDKSRHDVPHDQLFGYRGEVDTTHAGEVRLHEVQRVLPGGCGEVADRIQSAVDRIETLMIPRP